MTCWPRAVLITRVQVSGFLCWGRRELSTGFKSKGCYPKWRVDVTEIFYWTKGHSGAFKCILSTAFVRELLSVFDTVSSFRISHHSASKQKRARPPKNPAIASLPFASPFLCPPITRTLTIRVATPPLCLDIPPTPAPLQTKRTPITIIRLVAKAINSLLGSTGASPIATLHWRVITW